MINDSDDRLLETLAAWLEGRRHGFSALTLLSGDVSPRRYVRVLSGDAGSTIAACYPADARATGERFLRTGELLQKAGLRTPQVIDWDPDQGIMLLEDAGRRTVYQAVAGGEDPARWLSQAVDIAATISRLPSRAVEALNPPLDGRLMRRELQQSWDLVLEPRGLTGDGEWREAIRLGLFAMCDRLDQEARLPCHRDFMARNLLLDADHELVLIDHQDLRLGPPTYDLASLLNDSLYASPEQQRRALDRAEVARPEREVYHRTAAQRTLKIVGTFESFARRGVDRHLPLIEPSLAAAHYHLSRLPETSAVMSEAPETWNPLSATALAPSGD